jgi:hemolysin-activating ACP:hemolysin acyltransferase
MGQSSIKFKKSSLEGDGKVGSKREQTSLLREGETKAKRRYGFCPNPTCGVRLEDTDIITIEDRDGNPVEACRWCGTQIKAVRALLKERRKILTICPNVVCAFPLRNPDMFTDEDWEGKPKAFCNYCYSELRQKSGEEELDDIREIDCPNPDCGNKLRNYNIIFLKNPKEGDIPICSYCGVPLKIRKEDWKYKSPVQDCPGPNPKAFIVPEVKPKTSRAQDTFEPRCFYVPEVKERKVRAQQPFGESYE